MKKRFNIVLQHDQTDCGVSCLLSLLQYHGGNNSLEHLRLLSGTSVTGTTLLGLYQCARQVGFAADGVNMDLEHLMQQQLPCILHLLIDERLEHYVVCYGCLPGENAEETKFLIADPSKGNIEIYGRDLEKLWRSKAALLLKPNSNFVKAENQRNAKWKLFKSLVNDDIQILLITVFLGGIIAALGLTTAVFSQKLIDQILPSHKSNLLYIGLALLFVILVVRALLIYLRQNFLLFQTREFNNRITGSFFKALLFLPKSFFDNRKTGDMTARLTDVLRIQNNIAFVVGSVCIDILLSVVSAAFILFYSWQIALITFGFIPVIVAVTLKFVKPIQAKQREVMACYAFNESNYIDAIKGIDTIKGNNLEAGFSAINKGIFSVFQNKYFELGTIGNKFNIISEILGAVLTITIICASSLMVINHHLKIGEMIAIVTLVGCLIPAVGRLSQINLQIQEAKIAFDRMYEFVAIKPEHGRDADLGAINFKRIDLKNVVFRFPGRKPILNGIDLQLCKGELTALLGESGSGKSTLLQLLQKFYEPESGGILADNISLGDIHTAEWRNITACVFQDINIFNGSLLWNIALENDPEKLQQAYEKCEAMGFGRFFNEFPQGYGTMVGEDGINLSGGQRQLVGLARALCKEPQLLLLDEVTAAMDRNMEGFVMSLLGRKKQDTAIVFVTHRLQTIKCADQIYIIEDGRVQDFGKHQELLVKDNLYSRSLNDILA